MFTQKPLIEFCRDHGIQVQAYTPLARNDDRLTKNLILRGLAMERLETDWQTYPVLHLDLNAGKYDKESDLNDFLNDSLAQWEKIYGASPTEVNAELRFKGVIRRAFERTVKQVAVLVDEYDKPLLNTIDNETLHTAYRNTLKAFFSVLKSMDARLRFVFITGVSKFSHVSVFSDLNNLNDISMDPRYVDICGISEQELHEYFDGSIQELADANGMTFGEAGEVAPSRIPADTCGRDVDILPPD